MKRAMTKAHKQGVSYQAVFGDVSKIVDAARDSAVRSVNASMTAAYWLIGRRIVEFEQSGEERAEYGDALLERLAVDLTGRFGRGFSRQNIQNMRLFYLSYEPGRILQTPSGKLPVTRGQLIRQTPSGIFPATHRQMIRQTVSGKFNREDSVEKNELRRFAGGISTAMVRLCAAAFGQERECSRIL